MGNIKSSLAQPAHDMCHRWLGICSFCGSKITSFRRVNLSLRTFNTSKIQRLPLMEQVLLFRQTHVGLSPYFSRFVFRSDWLSVQWFVDHYSPFGFWLWYCLSLIYGFQLALWYIHICLKIYIFRIDYKVHFMKSFISFH